ncbi:MAG: hypothetical protein PHI49_12255 [Halothiobacillaceae bacterium]|jgi:hypothetical protein|nr:hypothetical protein [Halothiobacillaceae bacterium]
MSEEAVLASLPLRHTIDLHEPQVDAFVHRVEEGTALERRGGFCPYPVHVLPLHVERRETFGVLVRDDEGGVLVALPRELPVKDRIVLYGDPDSPRPRPEVFMLTALRAGQREVDAGKPLFIAQAVPAAGV